MTDKPENFEDEDIVEIEDDEMDQVKGGVARAGATKNGPPKTRGDHGGNKVSIGDLENHDGPDWNDGANLH